MPRRVAEGSASASAPARKTGCPWICCSSGTLGPVVVMLSAVVTQPPPIASYVFAADEKTDVGESRVRFDIATAAES